MQLFAGLPNLFLLEEMPETKVNASKSPNALQIIYMILKCQSLKWFRNVVITPVYIYLQGAVEIQSICAVKPKK